MQKSKARNKSGGWKRKALTFGLMAGAVAASTLVGDVALGEQHGFYGEVHSQSEFYEHSVHSVTATGRDYGGGTFDLVAGDSYKIMVENAHYDYQATDGRMQLHGSFIERWAGHCWPTVCHWTTYEHIGLTPDGEVAWHYTNEMDYYNEPAFMMDQIRTNLPGIEESSYPDGALTGMAFGSVAAAGVYVMMEARNFEKTQTNEELATIRKNNARRGKRR